MRIWIILVVLFFLFPTCKISAIEVVRGRFNTSIDLDWREDGQSLIGTAYNGAAQSSTEEKCGAGSLSFPNNTSYIEYTGVTLSDYAVFTISIWIKGSGGGRYLEFKSGAAWANAITFQVTSHVMEIYIWNSSGTSHTVASFNYLAFSGWNHFELNANGNTGVNNFFLNGISKGTSGGTFTRTAFPLKTGQSWTKPIGESFYQDDLLIYNNIQHMSNFTPPGCPGGTMNFGRPFGAAFGRGFGH